MSFQRSSATSPQALRAAMIEAEAVRLRMQGKNYDDISSELTAKFKAVISPKLAASAVKRAIARSKAETSETLKESREIQSLQLDELFFYAMKKVRAGEGSIQDVVKVMDRKAKLLGLDAAQKIEAKVKSDGPLLSSMSDDQLAKIEAAIGQGAELRGEGDDEDGFADLNEPIEYPE